MRVFSRLAPPLFAMTLLTQPVAAASPEAELAFLDAYKAAYEAQDYEAFTTLLQIDGAIEEAIDFYLLNMTAEFGGEISLSLEELTDEELAEISGPLPGLDGLDYVLKPTPYKRLVIDIVLPSGQSGGAAVFVGDLGDHIIISTPTRAP